jgi:hypothetical protein
MTSDFVNTAATDLVNKLENETIHKLREPLKTSSTYLKNQKLSTIKEDDKENATEIKSKEIEAPEVGMPNEEKKELLDVQEMNESRNEDSKLHSQAGYGDIDGIEVKQREEQKTEEATTNFDHVILMQMSAYYTFFLHDDNYREKKQSGETVIEPDKLLRGLKSKVIFQHEPLYEKLIKLIHKSLDLQERVKSKEKDKESSMHSSGMRTENEGRRVRGPEKDLKDMLGQVKSAIDKIEARIRKHLSKLIAGRPEKQKVFPVSNETVVKIAENLNSKYGDIIEPMREYMRDINTNRKDTYEVDMIRYLSFAYTRTELQQVFMKCFYEQFDENLDFGLNMKEFAACLNFVAKKLNNKAFMKKIFILMKVSVETTGGSLLNTENVKGAEFDVNIYRKAFLHLREFDNTDETKDVVTFKEMLPYLYCFFVAFETIAIKKRKNLYKQFKVWIISAFREAAEEYKAGQTPTISDKTVLKSLMKKGSNSYTYEEVIKALTILQSRHHENFGHAEFQVITENLQKVFDVDPVTFKSKKTAPLTSKKLFLFPLAVWENDVSHNNFNLLQYLAMKLSQLSMFQGLANEKKTDNLYFIREERLLLYNEAEIFTGKSRLSKYFRRFASFDSRDEPMPTGTFILKLVNNIKVLYPGFDFLDGVLTILHHFYQNHSGTKDLPDMLPPKEQVAIYENLPILLNAAMYERLFHFYLNKIGHINFETIYNNNGKNITMNTASSASFLDSDQEEGYPVKQQEDPDIEVQKIVQVTPEVRIEVHRPKLNDTSTISAVKQKKRTLVPREPTVYEGLELKQKRDKAVNDKYIDMKDLEFTMDKSKCKKKEPVKEEPTRTGGCHII